MERRSWKTMLSRSAQKWLRRHPEARSTLEALRSELEANPFQGSPLHGRCQGLYRLRKGDLRLVYWIDIGKCTIRILGIGYRENIYKELGC